MLLRLSLPVCASPRKPLPILRGLLAASLLCGLAVSGRPVRADLRFDSHAPHSALWKRLYSRLPDCWKTERTIVVEEVSDEEMDRLVERTEGRSTDHREHDNSVVD